MKTLDLIAILAVSAITLGPIWQFVRERQEQKNLETCQKNLKALTMPLHMYNTDNSGYFPKSLEPLAPTYLKTIPTCPRGDGDSYRFQTENVWVEPGWYQARFTISCRGGHRLNGVPVPAPIVHYEDEFLIH